MRSTNISFVLGAVSDFLCYDEVMNHFFGEEDSMRFRKKYISINQKSSLPYDPVFYKTLRKIARDPVVLRMKEFPHHGNTDCYTHCLHVAYFNYKLCKWLHLDYEAATRAGMLHDLFLYDWHTHAEETGERFHGLTHPVTALKNAHRYFTLNPTEKDVILNHMWPVTPLKFPHTKEGWIIVLTDKYCGLLETLKMM